LKDLQYLNSRPDAACMPVHNVYTVSEKTLPLFFNQMLTDFPNSFRDAFRGQLSTKWTLNFENPLTFGEDMDNKKVAQFFRDTCIWNSSCHSRGDYQQPIRGTVLPRDQIVHQAPWTD